MIIHELSEQTTPTLNFCNQRIKTCLHMNAVAREFGNKIVLIKTQVGTDL